MKKIFLHKIFFVLALFSSTLFAQNKNEEIILTSGNQGFIPAWLVAGPIEFPTVGFGQAKDTIAIGEPNISPVEGDFANSILPEKEKEEWFLQSVDKDGFVDFDKSIQWNVNTNIPTKIWYVKAGYAFTEILSDNDKEALLLLGSNSQVAVYLNGERIHSVNSNRNAIIDQDTIKINLKRGINKLIVRILNTHQNLGVAFFGTMKWQWGFFARVVDVKGEPLNNIKYVVKSKNKKNDFNVVSTFFFKKDKNGLNQRIDFEINSYNPYPVTGKIKIKSFRNFEVKIDSILFGNTRHSIYIPEILKDIKAETELTIGSEIVAKNIEYKKQKKYDLHLMLLNHTDVGYTHPQPVTEVLHCNTLDDVLKKCKEQPDFHWTIETTWQLEAYERLRSKEKFLELISLIKEGRVAVSPIYTNPFTGYVSEEEMLRSFDKAIEYKNKYGISYLGAVYNDVPGQCWFLPQALNKAGIKFIAEGINEVYGDYKLQRNLPKVFKWEAADGSRVVTYINEAYNEGKTFGLESNDLLCVEQNIWDRINKLEAKDYAPSIILINSSFSDNSILAGYQYDLGLKWNKEYEYPKFISSDVNMFTNALIKSDAYEKLPVLKGDWTSNWDIFYQGEFERHRDVRRIQHNLLTAEKLSTLNNLLDPSKQPMNGEISESYRRLLQFTGHGSGLEYGYGSPEANKLTMQYRQNYVDDALLGSESVILKGMFEITKPEESLEAEGLYVFNSLSWKRNELVEIQFPFETSPQYVVIEPVTNKIIPSFRKDHRQYFIATDVPSFGYKKFILKAKTEKNEFKSGLVKSENIIENQFYKLTFEENRVVSIIDKKSGKELLNNKSRYAFANPTVEKYQLNQIHAAISGIKTSLEIIDESPVKLSARINRENDVFEYVEISLIEGIDKVFINASANLQKLKETKITEEFGIPFSFNIPNAKVKSEILGGFIEQEKDRLPGIDHDGVSLRRAISIFNDDMNIILSTEDVRVIRIRKDSLTNEPVIISNPLNNFPDSWNRHEDEIGRINFHYAFASSEGTFNPAKTTKFGYELNTPLELRKSWFKPIPSFEEYLTIDNENVILLNLKSSEKGKLIRLINSDTKSNQKAKIKTKLFTNFTADVVDLYLNKIKKLEVSNNIIEAELKPGEFLDILINNK